MIYERNGKIGLQANGVYEWGRHNKCVIKAALPWDEEKRIAKNISTEVGGSKKYCIVNIRTL